jgi:ABC-2 type transport system ATP-binding protein
MTHSIEVCQLVKHFPRRKGYLEMARHPFRQEYVTALQGIDLQVERGELFGLLGPNGAGKTTLIKILATLVLPTSGSALVNGYDVTHAGARVRESIGYVMSDERSFHWRLTGRQNLRFFAALNNLPPAQTEKRIQETLTLLDLQDHADETFQNYSTGMRHRLAIARAMLTNPDILFLDEPTRSLDPSAAQALRQFIRRDLVEKHGKTVLLATHNLPEAEAMCDRLAIIHHGQIQAYGKLADLRAKLCRTPHYLVQTDNDANQATNLLKTLPGVMVLSDGRIALNGAHISDVIAALVARGVRLQAIIPEEVSLEDIFAQFVR